MSSLDEKLKCRAAVSIAGGIARIKHEILDDLAKTGQCLESIVAHLRCREQAPLIKDEIYRKLARVSEEYASVAELKTEHTLAMDLLWIPLLDLHERLHGFLKESVSVVRKSRAMNLSIFALQQKALLALEKMHQRNDDLCSTNEKKRDNGGCIEDTIDTLYAFLEEVALECHNVLGRLAVALQDYDAGAQGCIMEFELHILDENTLQLHLLDESMLRFIGRPAETREENTFAP